MSEVKLTTEQLDVAQFGKVLHAREREATQHTPSGGVYKIRKAKGARWGNHKKIAIAFSADDFEAISLKAQMEGRSFAAQVRHYVELGRKCDDR